MGARYAMLGTVVNKGAHNAEYACMSGQLAV